MKTLRNDIHINASIDEVHNFGKDPKHWDEWYENLIGPTKVTGTGEVGTIVEFEYSLMGIHVPITLEVIEDARDHWVARFSGGMEGEQIVNLVKEGDGSHVEMIYNYTLKNKVLDKISDMRIMEKMLNRSMKHTIENWKTICEMKH